MAPTSASSVMDLIHLIAASIAFPSDDETLMVQYELDRQKRLVNEHPKTFSVTPQLEVHMKVLADLARGDADVIARELREAWELQRG